MENRTRSLKRKFRLSHEPQDSGTTGVNAGKIYRALKGQSPLAAEALQKHAAIDDIEEFHKALVWLTSQLLVISESPSPAKSRFFPRLKAEVYYRLAK
ncbi:MAG TPA: hypothetical protein VL688_12825 [Verrucomicrobiae bacterium]|jgi:hypothetical protein|nr:hypothetical protein [Verrucomicrobiae bacterium]